MELTKECEREIEQIKATTCCANNFHCEQAGFEDLSSVKVYQGANVIQCGKADVARCAQASFLPPIGSSEKIAFCMCPLRKYLALQLGT